MHLDLFCPDPQLAADIRAALEKRAHAIAAHASLAELQAGYRREHGALLLLGWHEGAAAVLGWARDKMPVLCLCSPGDEGAIDAILAGGAHDYVVTPLRRAELAARVAGLLRRAYPDAPAPEQLAFGRYRFEPARGAIAEDGVARTLTRKEFELALLFFRHLGRPLSRAYLAEMVWGGESEVPTRTIDTHVSRVRSKLGLVPERGYRLQPVYSYGYRLEALP